MCLIPSIENNEQGFLKDTKGKKNTKLGRFFWNRSRHVIETSFYGPKRPFLSNLIINLGNVFD